MVTYKCIKCENEVKEEELDKRFVCPECGSKIFFKPRKKVKNLKTD